MKGDDKREPLFDAAESKTPCMRGNSMRENRETQATPSPDGGGGRSEKAQCRTPDMHVAGESDGPIVPAKWTNKPGTPAAESMEERGSLKGNATRHVLAPDTVPRYARHHRARLRLVEILYLDRCTQERSRMR